VLAFQYGVIRELEKRLKAEALFKKGVLTINLPKTQQTKGRKIEVKAK